MLGHNLLAVASHDNGRIGQFQESSTTLVDFTIYPFLKVASMCSNPFTLVEITDINDDLLLPWLELYETAFPPNDRILVSSQLGLLKAKMHGAAADNHILAAVDAQRALVGIVQYESIRDISVVFLWYLAIQRELQNRGLGTQIYREVCNRLISTGIRALIFEVEIPEESQSEEDRRLAKRRIVFYRRLGAYLLRGVDYVQHVGWHQPPTPMHIMVHPLQPLNAQAAYGLAKVVFEDAIEPTGPLALE